MLLALTEAACLTVTAVTSIMVLLGLAAERRLFIKSRALALCTKAEPVPR